MTELSLTFVAACPILLQVKASPKLHFHMPLKFDVDGKMTENPSPEDISNGFASIDAEGMRAISIVLLDRSPILLWAFGHPKEGYALQISEGLSRKVTPMKKPVTHTEVIRIFQDFARGDDSWQNKFTWEQLEDSIVPTAVICKRVALYIAVFALLIILLKYVLKIL
jgi:hypothetical protein